MNLRKHTVVITGATGAIGSRTVRAIARQGPTVIAAGRSPEKLSALTAACAAEGLGNVSGIPLELGSVSGIFSAVTKLRTMPSIVVHCAGAWPRQRRETSDGVELAIGINHLGAAAVTLALLPRLAEGSRVLFVASGLHATGQLRFDDLEQSAGGYSGQRAYAAAKLANVLYANELARRAPHLRVASMHPGVVISELTREFPEVQREAKALAISADEAGRNVAAAALDFKSPSGTYYNGSRKGQPHRRALDLVAARTLWDWTAAKLTALGLSIPSGL